MTTFSIGNHGSNRFEVMGDGHRLAVFDALGDAELFVAAKDKIAIAIAERAEAAAEALASLTKRIYGMIYEDLLRGDGCAFCGPAGFYRDGEYWHSEDCPFESIEGTLRQYEEIK